MNISKQLRFRDLKDLGIVSNWPTVQRWIEQEGFPPGRRLGPNTRTWSADEIAAWLANRPMANATGRVTACFKKLKAPPTAAARPSR